MFTTINPSTLLGTHIRSIVKDAGKMIGLFYGPGEYLTQSNILYIYKNQIKLKTE